MENIQDIIKDIIKEKGYCCADIQDDDILTEIGVDSFSIIKLVIELEKYFNFEFEDKELSYKTLSSVNSIATYIKKRLEEQG